jgi:hypothetical protein
MKPTVTSSGSLVSEHDFEKASPPTIHFMVLCSMALLTQYMPPTAKWYVIPGRLSPAFFLTLLGERHADPDLSMETTKQSFILPRNSDICHAS